MRFERREGAGLPGLTNSPSSCGLTVKSSHAGTLSEKRRRKIRVVKQADKTAEVRERTAAVLSDAGSVFVPHFFTLCGVVEQLLPVNKSRRCRSAPTARKSPIQKPSSKTEPTTLSLSAGGSSCEGWSLFVGEGERQVSQVSCPATRR